MPESLEQSRERLVDEASRLPGVAEAMRLYGHALPMTDTSTRAEAIRLTVASATNSR